jgi:uridine kinase
VPNPFDFESTVNFAVDRMLELVETETPTPLLIIDGRSGSGKTSLAKAIQERLFKDGESLPRVIHMDDLYDGWHGLQAGHDYLLRNILKPLEDKRVASWQEYDWEIGERNRWREFSGGTPLIVEGCGSLSSSTAPLAQLSIWVSAHTDVRQSRWISRVGHDHDQWWPIWAAQELEFYAREKSEELAAIRCENS